jgi:cysteine desulfurase
MNPYWTDSFGNAAAVHDVGSEAKEAVISAREQVAAIINSPAECINFTSGATAANNILLKGIVAKCRRILGPTKQFVTMTTNVEHSSVLNCIKELRYRDEHNHRTVYIKVDGEGNLNLDEIDRMMSESLDDILVVSVMAANNEIGTINDIEAIGEICRRHDVFFHTDATQAMGRVDIDVQRMNIDALSMSAHKIYGPKGVGALYIKDSNKILPLIDGGGQENVTSGTLNVPAIVGFGKACEILKAEQYAERKHTLDLRNKMLGIIKSNIPRIIINGTMKNRLPNNLNLTIEGVKAEALVLGMDDVMMSAGAACSSGRLKPSHVIEALGKNDDGCSIRIGLGKGNTEEDIDYASAKIIEVVEALRSASDEQED